MRASGRTIALVGVFLVSLSAAGCGTDNRGSAGNAGPKRATPKLTVTCDQLLKIAKHGQETSNPLYAQAQFDSLLSGKTVTIPQVSITKINSTVLQSNVDPLGGFYYDCANLYLYFHVGESDFGKMRDVTAGTSRTILCRFMRASTWQNSNSGMLPLAYQLEFEFIGFVER